MKNGSIISFFREVVKPKRWIADSLYFILNKTDDTAEAYVTSNYGVPKPVVNKTEIIKLIQTYGIAINNVSSYRSSFDYPYIYSGFLLEGVPIVKRYLNGVDTFAQNVIDLETSWTNRLTLTYV